MKTTLILFGLAILLGCSGVKQAGTGFVGPASLVFIGNPERYSDSVFVKIDENIPFPIIVTPDSKNNSMGKGYEVVAGKHFVTVLNKGTIIFKKQLAIRDKGAKPVKVAERELEWSI